MAENNGNRVIEEHKREFTQHLGFHLDNFPNIIHKSEQNFNDQSCLLTIQSDNDVDDVIDGSTYLQTIFDEASNSFSHQQFFVKRNGFRYGVITTWENPNMIIPGINRNHPIRWMFMLETNEQGHEFDVEIYIVVWLL